MPNSNDYHAFKSTRVGKGFGVGLGKPITIIVVIILLFFIFDGASWEAIETLLALGFIAYLLFK